MYIGQTKRDIEIRWKQHLKSINTQQTKHKPLYRQMKKYGIENFKFEIIEECSDEEVDTREIYWIDYYDTFKNGYNLTRGGEGGLIYDYDEIVELYKKYKSINKVQEIKHIDKGTIHNILKTKGITILNPKETNLLINQRLIYMKDLKTNETIKVFYTIMDQTRHIHENNPEYNSTFKSKYNTISNQLKHNGIQYGYKWEIEEKDFTEDELVEIINSISKNKNSNKFNNKPKQIQMIDINTGKVIKIFLGYRKQQEYLSMILEQNNENISKIKTLRGGIRACQNGNKLSYKGYIWRIIPEDGINKIEEGDIWNLNEDVINTINKIKKNNRKLEIEPQVLKLYGKYKSINKVSKELGISKYLVRRILDDNNIERYNKKKEKILNMLVSNGE